MVIAIHGMAMGECSAFSNQQAGLKVKLAALVYEITATLC